jgi:hypothetical protein
MNPAKFLNGREPGRELDGIDCSGGIGECDAVLERKEAVATWLLVLDGKAYEIFGRGAVSPVHSQ